MDINQVKQIAKAAYEINKVNKGAWREKMYEKRWKYFFTIWIYIAVCVFFLWLGHTVQDSFFDTISYYIWMGLSSIFLILGVCTMFYYLWLIVRGKK